MSNSSETGPAARRTTSVLGLLAVVLLAVLGGVLVAAPTSGAAWVDPPIEAPIAAQSESRPTSPARTPRRSVVTTGDEDAGADDITVTWPRRTVAVPSPPDDPPPGRSPPSR